MALLDAAPPDMFLQVRYEYNKYDNFSPDEAADYRRIGFHDDALRGDRLFSNNTGGADRNSAVWKKTAAETAALLVDGEMYWGWANSSADGGGMIPQGLFHAKRMREHHFTSLSIKHNYLFTGREGGLL